MKAQIVWASAVVIVARSLSLVVALSSHVRGRHPRSRARGTRLRSSLDADALSELEHLIADLRQQRPARDATAASPGRGAPVARSVDDAAAAHGMPWTTTLGRSDEADPLLYMPFWDWQLEFMTSSLSNLHPLACTARDGRDVSYNENREKRARVVNQCYASDEYRKIRMTYYDAGDSVQVFNSVWYPDAKYNLPVLGIDLLSFNRKKYLAIVDFQPLHPRERDHATTFEHVLAPIKDRYDHLKGRMSSRFYDETQFFSQEMLFARFEDDAVVRGDLFPAFQAYVQAHVALVKTTPPATAPDALRRVFGRHRAYDTYSAARDPAAGLFAAVFGKAWADDFIHDFLFSLSERAGEGEARAAGPPAAGGPPRGRDPGGPPAREGAPAKSTTSSNSVPSL